jgi:hypothetical protein
MEDSAKGTLPAGPGKKKFIVKSIFIAHAQRIGWIRTGLGGFLQYLSVFEFIMLHLTVIVVLYRWMLVPFFKLRRFRIRDYILLDRGKIEGMCLFDRFNCEFCVYANGTAKLWNVEVDELANADLSAGSLAGKLIAGVYGLCLFVFLFFNFFFSKILFFFISLFLGMHRADTGAIRRELAEKNYAGRHGSAIRSILRFAKLYAGSLAINLEQIESSWCPLKHIQTPTAVVPDFHANFFERDQLDEMVKTMETVGSVSPRKPKY